MSPGIPRSDDQKRLRCMKSDVLLMQMVPHHLARPIFDITDTKSLLNLPFTRMKR